MATLDHQSLPPTNLGRVDEEMASPVMSRRVFTWRENGVCFHPSYGTNIDRFGAKGIIVCGGILLSSCTPVYVFDASTVNSQCYTDQILKAYVKF
ncbi:hypothetical protein TNCV_5076501 [Trichonephila clavipes]|uniref:Uncharacterized protein n=1 Tax=Trichonephila clavipes TaxID=2585209 RepID=A0A8X6RXV7_TRICX|nr:hypothetical protein TNCV_5076501 [Trichonephila clavipes]